MKTKNALHIRELGASFIGTLERTNWHQHGALVMLIGLSGPISIAFDGVEYTCSSALIDAGVSHILDCKGEIVSVTYYEIDSPESSMLRRDFLQNQSVQFDFVSAHVRKHVVRSKLLSPNLETILGRRLDSLSLKMDDRVRVSIDQVKAQQTLNLMNEDVARTVALSPSRFRHLFKQETGLPFRHYRLWRRLANFTYEMKTSGSVTDSALIAGFYDSAHLGNSFKKMIGLSPSQLFNNLDEFELRR